MWNFPENSSFSCKCGRHLIALYLAEVDAKLRYNALKYLGLIRGEHRKDYKVALDYFYRASQIDKTDVQVNSGMIVYSLGRQVSDLVGLT